MTTVADGLFQYGGQPVSGGLVTSKLFSTKVKGRVWFVDASSGVNGDGKTPSTAFSTMQRAFNAAGNGDIIYFVGKVTEQLVTPVQIFDVTVVGCGNRPRHADAAPTGSNYAAAQWGAASGGTAAQATVRVLQQGWRFVNILFTAVDTNAAMIEIVRNAGSGNDERDGSHTSVYGCRFSGAGVGVRGGVAATYTEIPFNVELMDNDFYANTFGIRSAIQCNAWQIKGNRFNASTNAITAQLGASLIVDNVVTGFTAASSSGGIDLRSGAGANVVTKNFLGGTYSNAGGYNGAASDQWMGNFADVTGGVTQADPA